MKEMFNFIVFWKITVCSLIFWIVDFIFHYEGVGESNFYYLSKFGNAVIFAVLWFLAFNWKESWKKITYSIVFGTWVSLYYLLASYSGFVQYFGISARYTPPPFVFFGIYFHPILWWVLHSLAFYLGIIIAGKLIKSR